MLIVASTGIPKVVQDSLTSQCKLPASSPPQWAETGATLAGSIVQHDGRESAFFFVNESEAEDAQQLHQLQI